MYNVLYFGSNIATLFVRDFLTAFLSLSLFKENLTGLGGTKKEPAVISLAVAPKEYEAEREKYDHIFLLLPSHKPWIS